MSISQAFRRLLPRNDFARHVSVLVGGTAASQVLLVAVSPLLTRLYSPEDFGVLAVFAGLLGTIAVISSLRYQLAIPLPEDDADAASVAVLSGLIAIGLAGLSALIVFLAGEPLMVLLKTPVLIPYLWLMPVGILLLGLYGVVSYWAIRTKAFPAIAKTKLVQAVGAIAVQLGGYALGPLALLVAQITGQAAGISSLTTQTVRPRWAVFRAVTAQDVWAAARRWRRFPLYSTWSGLFNTAGMQLPPLLFAALFGPAAAGIYLLAQRVLGMPMQLLGQAIANVFFSRSAEARRQGQLAPLVANIHERLAQVAMPPALVIILAGPELFALVFGPDWRQAGQFAQWMAPWLYLVFITSPLSQLFSVLEKQAQGMLFQTVLFIARIGSLFIGAWLGDLMFTVALFSMASALCWVGFLVWIIRASGNGWQALVRPTAQSAVATLLLVAPLILYPLAPQGIVLWLACLVLSAVLIGVRYVLLLRKVW